MSTDAHISIDQIITSWLGKRGYTLHYYVKAAFLAAEAVQELSLTSLPMLHHALLTKEAGQNWYTLPKGYTDYVRVGVRFGDTWMPLRISERLMPYSNTDGDGDMNPAEFGEDMNVLGANSSWYSGASNPASFAAGSFSAGSFSTVPTPAPTPTAIVDGWGVFSDGYAYASRYGLGVYFDVARGIIVAPDGFAFDEIYLVYTGIGTIDNMTGIPVYAQAAIESYIDWKYAANKRDISRGEAQDWERKFDNQHRLLRARVQRWSIEEVAASFEDRFDRRITVGFLLSDNTNNSTVHAIAIGGYPYSYPATYGN